MEILHALKLYFKFCLLFHGKDTIDKILGVFGWIAVLVGGYSVTRLLSAIQ